MSKHSHRKHSEGLNGSRVNDIIDSVTGCSDLDPDYALRRIPGTREGIRKGALAAVDQFLRNGGELPIPNLDTGRNVGKISLSTVNSPIVE